LDTSCASSYFRFWNFARLGLDLNIVLFWKCICKNRLVKVGELFAHSWLFHILAFVFFFVTIWELLKFCRQILRTIEESDMLYKQLSRKRDYLGFIRDLELHSWYDVIINLSLLQVYIPFLCIYMHTGANADCWAKYRNQLLRIWKLEIILDVKQVVSLKLI
jgi:hypothetical protein